MPDDQTGQAPNTNQPNNFMGLGVNPSAQMPSTPAPDQPTTSAPSLDTSATPLHDDELDTIKQKALKQLSPLVDKLDQEPADRYKTLMMMIQASDDQSLLGQAYECAQQIQDEKAKAEALLSIVNEINYFKQKSA